jgi:hypothetical protein
VVLGCVKWQKQKSQTRIVRTHSFALSITAVGGNRRKNCLRRSRVFLRPSDSKKYPSRGYKLQVSAAGGRERRVPFLVRFWASKNEHIK